MRRGYFPPTGDRARTEIQGHANTEDRCQDILYETASIKFHFINVDCSTILGRDRINSPAFRLRRAGHTSSVIKTNIEVGRNCEEPHANNQDRTSKPHSFTFYE